MMSIINCKDVGVSVCTHTMYGDTEEEILENAKKYGIDFVDILKNHSMKK